MDQEPTQHKDQTQYLERIASLQLLQSPTECMDEDREGNTTFTDLHFADTFIQSDLQLFMHAHIHTLTKESTTQGDSQVVGSSQGEVPRSGTP